MPPRNRGRRPEPPSRPADQQRAKPAGTPHLNPRSAAGSAAARQEGQRQARIAEAHKARRRMNMLWGGGVLALTLVIGAFIGLNVANAAIGKKTTDDCNKARDVATGACRHIPNDAPIASSGFDPYSTNPPTSGPHWSNPMPRGIYSEGQDERLVHSLEHGYVVINVNCDSSTCPDDFNRLVGIYQSYPSKVIVNYRPGTPDKIAVTAWTRILRLDVVEEGKIKKFIDAYRGGGAAPEPNAG